MNQFCEMVQTVNYNAKNTYETLNQRGENTRNYWLVLHGIGYLSRYFLKYFKHLDPEKNYIVAPQAPSKYYLNGKYRHVGASWLTREALEMEIDNNLNCLQAVIEAEELDQIENLNIMGYSQGVSIATRLVAKKNLKCSNLILHSGKVPGELSKEDFEFLKDTKVSFIYGNKDEFIDEKLISSEKTRLREIFPGDLEFISFEGGHEVNKDILSKFA